MMMMIVTGSFIWPQSYRHYPSNLEVIRWLAAYFTEMHVPEKAIVLFERASQMRPNEPQWPLAVASSTQRVGNYHKALQILKSTRSKFPDSLECNYTSLLPANYIIHLTSTFSLLYNYNNKRPSRSGATLYGPRT